MVYFSVQDVSVRMWYTEGAIKRWLDSGKFPNAFKVCDKDGWRILLSDLNGKVLFSSRQEQTSMEFSVPMTTPTNDERHLILLSFQTVVLTSPSDGPLDILSSVRIHRTLEILIVMKQEEWTPSTLPKKLGCKRQNFEDGLRIELSTQISAFPSLNWLEEE
ncbi:hypothetical protein C4A75_00025 [Brevibacillus laterosporus]|uniref:hypothetical protein n=1 Tax=Brevibacillus laterosporus TaxID=1465 RepID=UPI000CE5623E|nr:hypothetical protein [Brevibacillus laterosporus]PPA87643.1 hypothetical protein C4A75_00025 [Brevibacillus laterosporus]